MSTLRRRSFLSIALTLAGDSVLPVGGRGAADGPEFPGDDFATVEVLATGT